MGKRHDFDGAWKQASDWILKELMEFIFPEAAVLIDWSITPVFLDSELQKILGAKYSKKWRLDRLIQFQLLDGDKKTVYLHHEYQNKPEKDFTLRLYRSNRRIEETYGEEVASLVVLTDENSHWRPSIYEKEVLGTRHRFEFVTCKLQDFIPQLEELEKSSNRIALFIAAHLRTQQTKKDPLARWEYKKKLHYWIYQLKLSPEDFRKIYLLIDDLMILPDNLQKKHTEEIFAFEKEKSMPYVSQFEKRTLKKGRQEGRHEALCQAVLVNLEEHFGFIEKDISEQLEAIEDEKKLRELLRIAFRAESLEAFQKELRAA